MKVSKVSLLVTDYDTAIAYFTDFLGFYLYEDTDMGGGKRWVVVGPKGELGAQFVLAQPKNAQEVAAVGNQAGGRVFLFLETDDFEKTYRLFKDKGVAFLESPRFETYGTVVVFQDPFGNKWDLIGPPETPIKSSDN